MGRGEGFLFKSRRRADSELEFRDDMGSYVMEMLAYLLLLPLTESCGRCRTKTSTLLNHSPIETMRMRTFL